MNNIFLYYDYCTGVSNPIYTSHSISFQKKKRKRVYSVVFKYFGVLVFDKLVCCGVTTLAGRLIALRPYFYSVYYTFLEFSIPLVSLHDFLFITDIPLQKSSPPFLIFVVLFF